MSLCDWIGGGGFATRDRGGGPRGLDHSSVVGALPCRAGTCQRLEPQPTTGADTATGLNPEHRHDHVSVQIRRTRGRHVIPKSSLPSLTAYTALHCPALPCPAMHTDAFPADEGVDVDVRGQKRALAAARSLDCRIASQIARSPHCHPPLDYTALLGEPLCGGTAKTGEHGNIWMERLSYPALCGRCRRRKQSREAAVPDGEGRLSDQPTSRADWVYYLLLDGWHGAFVPWLVRPIPGNALRGVRARRCDAMRGEAMRAVMRHHPQNRPFTRFTYPLPLYTHSLTHALTHPYNLHPIYTPASW